MFPDQAPSGELAVKAGAAGGYWCRQCGLSGDYVQWLVDVEGWDWTKIFEFLGVEGEASVRHRVKPVRSVQPRQRIGRELGDLLPVELPPEKWREHAEKLVSECASALERNPHLIEWLDRRGVPLSVAKEYRLGWHAGVAQKGDRPPCAYRSREGWGLPRIMNERGRPKSIWLPRGLVIPNYRDDQLVAVRIRRPNSDVSPGQKKYVLAAGSNQKACMMTPGARAYVVVEAGLDGLACLAAAPVGVGMCALGTLTAYPDKQAGAWLGAAIDILNVLDFEPQGRGEKYGNKFRHWWSARFPQCRRVPVPVGKDPGEFVEQAGFKALGTWLGSQLSPAVRVTAPPPKGSVPSMQKTVSKGVTLPDHVEELRGLVAANRVTLYVSQPSGRVYGGDMPADVSGRVGDLCSRKVVQDWLSEIGEDVVTYRNFMKPMEGK